MMDLLTEDILRGVLRTSQGWIMRTTFLLTVSALLLTPGADRAQPPDTGKMPSVKPPPDEFRSLVREVEEAYKAPYEVDKDILDELRKQYRNPTPEREAKIFREIRRLYNLTPEQEQEIIRELRSGYERPSPAQEERIFQAIRRNGRLPLGTVPASAQSEQAGKLFRGFDRNGDGQLAPEEMPDTLRTQWQRWDRNGDGLIDFAEYGDYYQAHLRAVSDRVASGEISIKLPKAASLPPVDLSRSALPTVPPAPGVGTPRDPLPFAIRFGKLPPGLPNWFVEYDTDQDGQVSLYEWRWQGRPNDEFTSMDLDGDCLIAPEELLRFLAARTRQRPAVNDDAPR
jgi:hypothetical protein